MQPIKITIEGDYYDCQIYRGRLYLWTFDGDLKVYDWDETVKSLIERINSEGKKNSHETVMHFCFLDGKYLYEKKLIEIFKDPDFNKLLQQKISQIQNIRFVLTKEEIDRFLLGQQEAPTGLLPTDTEIYSNKLYFIHEKGLYSTSVHRPKSNKYLVSSRPLKLWDCNLLSIKANKYPQLALSGGDEGLFELNLANCLPRKLRRVEKTTPIFQISKNHSSFSNYSYMNIYSTSLIKNSFLAMFKWDIIKDEDQREKPFRDYDSNINDQEIFKDKKDFISWGIDDKLYKITESGFEIIKYNHYPNKEMGEERFTQLDLVKFNPGTDKVINAGTAYFGNIVECEEGLVVIQSNEELLKIPGPITRWRVYPRSLNYENHLHVILDNRIEIYSFNHDYFLNQEEKKIGIQFTEKKHWRKARTSDFDTDEAWIGNEELPF